MASFENIILDQTTIMKLLLLNNSHPSFQTRIALKLPIYFVRPVKWKKYFNLIKTNKDASRTKVIEIFPYISSKISRKKDSNKADSILIAKYFEETQNV